MSVFLIMDISVVDDKAYDEYRGKVSAVIEQFGGTYRVRGGPASNAEGDWQPGRIVVVEFDSEQLAREFLDSDAYAPLKKIRHSAAISRGILVETFNP